MPSEDQEDHRTVLVVSKASNMVVQAALTSKTMLFWETRSTQEGVAVPVGSDRALMTEERVDLPSLKRTSTELVKSA